MSLVDLPVELLYEIGLYAVSSALPQTCKTLHAIFKASPASYRAQYLVACMEQSHPREDTIITKILRYPICDEDVLEAYFRLTPSEAESRKRWEPELPRRLFRSLATNSSSMQSPFGPCVAPGHGRSESETLRWMEQDHPLPLLRYLYTCPHIHPPAVNSHKGYALTKAVQARFVPLIQFLLSHGAMPHLKSSLAILIAISRRDLPMVRMLVERSETTHAQPMGEGAGAERDRVSVTPEMLRIAVKCKAQDIIEYFTREKGCIPDIHTLLMLE
ncbi:hypothetical protein EDD16DRAFT_1900377 [Pisolithus croceorrhizus]|nr:hypothetical protein EDD16DRAFT_1900377 [Pisolithus croceorrhizus]KAI6110511.1 hypothetical protein EV401DRAFT_2270636 [Pisolithus croceorrhizus]